MLLLSLFLFDVHQTYVRFQPRVLTLCDTIRQTEIDRYSRVSISFFLFYFRLFYSFFKYIYFYTSPSHITKYLLVFFTFVHFSSHISYYCIQYIVFNVDNEAVPLLTLTYLFSNDLISFPVYTRKLFDKLKIR